MRKKSLTVYLGSKIAQAVEFIIGFCDPPAHFVNCLYRPCHSWAVALCRIWDRVFGTYRAVTGKRSRVGLQGIEAAEMTTNPFCLAFAGTAQMAYELINASSVKEFFSIVFGTSDYMPEMSKDYVLGAAILSGPMRKTAAMPAATYRSVP